MQSSSDGFYEMKVLSVAGRQTDASFIQVNRSSVQTFERQIVLEKNTRCNVFNSLVYSSVYVKVRVNIFTDSYAYKSSFTAVISVNMPF